MAGNNGHQGNNNGKGHGARSGVTSVVIGKFVFAPLCVAIIILCVYVPSERRFAVTVLDPHPGGQRSRNTKTSLIRSSTAHSAWHNTTHHLPNPAATTDLELTADRIATTRIPKSEITHLIQPATACEPVQRIVFIKTHKTGSTTMASILERFGYLRNLSFVVNRGSHILSNEGLFNRKMAFQIPNRTRQDFDMLVNHVRYNRKEMEVAVPGAKYISIIRDPVTQLESAFGYFEMAKHLNINTRNPFETFMGNPEKYYAMKGYFWTRARNGMLYDLGFDHKDDEDVAIVQKKISVLSKEIDLILITEFFDESLIVLRKIMCWDFEDILYISNGIRSKSHRYAVSEDTSEKVRVWSAADVMLYEHFNRTLWQKVKEYGPTFQQDLDHFRSMQRDVMQTCVDQRKNNTGDRREDKLTLKTDSKYCEDLLRADVPYTALIRKGMITRAAEEAAETAEAVGRLKTAENRTPSTL